jgi:hypothetical protein
VLFHQLADFMIRTVLLFIFSALAWFVWQQPAPAPVPETVRSSIPDLPLQSTHNSTENITEPAEQDPDELWRVVTRRLITPAAATALSQRLKKLNMEPIMFTGREAVEMHAFDDQLLFNSHEKAVLAKNDWLEKNIEASIIKTSDSLYIVGLGRFFQIEYAEDIQKRLKKIGKPYRYQRRSVPIPSWRFTFAASDKQQAEKIWQQLQSMGLSMPVLIPEEQFQKIYADRKEESLL